MTAEISGNTRGLYIYFYLLIKLSGKLFYRFHIHYPIPPNVGCCMENTSRMKTARGKAWKWRWKSMVTSVAYK